MRPGRLFLNIAPSIVFNILKNTSKESVQMGKPLMLQEADNARIESLKKRLHARTKIEVVRSALDLLERDAERAERVAKWHKAVGVAARESRTALRDFHRGSRLRKLD